MEILIRWVSGSMPSIRTHLIAGTILGVLSYFLYKHFYAAIDKPVNEIGYVVLLVTISLIYSIMPDIDLETSTTYKWYAIIGAVTSLYIFLINNTVLNMFGIQVSLKAIAIVFLIGLVLLQFIQHREFFHSIAAGLLFSAPLYYFSLGLFLTGLLAYYLHLFLDDELFDGLFT